MYTKEACNTVQCKSNTSSYSIPEYIYNVQLSTQGFYEFKNTPEIEQPFEIRNLYIKYHKI